MRRGENTKSGVKRCWRAGYMGMRGSAAATVGLVVTSLRVGRVRMAPARVDNNAKMSHCRARLTFSFAALPSPKFKVSRQRTERELKSKNSPQLQGWIYPPQNKTRQRDHSATTLLPNTKQRILRRITCSTARRGRRRERATRTPTWSCKGTASAGTRSP